MNSVLNRSKKSQNKTSPAWLKRYVAVLFLGVFYVIMSWLFTIFADSFWK